MSNLKTIQMTIDEIVVINDFNVRASQLSQSKIAEYAENFDRLPHVSGYEVQDKIYLVDGWHRLEAARKLNKESINVSLVGSGTFVEAQDLADKANLAHGIMLTQEQRKEIAHRFLSRHKDWSSRQVAEIMGIGHATVSRWIKEEAVSNETVDETIQPSKSAASQERRASAIGIEVVASTFSRWWKQQGSTLPIDQWSSGLKNKVKESLKPIADLYGSL